MFIGINSIKSIAITPQRGIFKQLKPICKHLNLFLEKILGDTKFTVNSTDVILMTIVVLLLCLVCEAASHKKITPDSDISSSTSTKKKSD